MSTELESLKEIARIATREALQGYVLPKEWEQNLTLGTGFDGDYRIFELYISGEQPEDAILISTARVHRKTKTVQIQISNLSKRATI